MSMPEHLKGKGNVFSSTNQPKNRGRKKSRLKEFVSDNNLSRSDVSKIVKGLFDKTEDELKDLAKDKKQPFLIRMYIRALFEDMKTGKMSNVNALMDRAIGKPTEKVEHLQVDVKGFDVSLSDEEQQAYEERIEEFMGKDLLNKFKEETEDSKK